MEIHTIDVIGGLPVEKLSILPTWDGDQAGRIIYVINDDNYYFGTKIGWYALTPSIHTTKLLGNTGRSGGTGETGHPGGSGPPGGTGGTGGTGKTGATGGSGTTGGSGGSGPTGGTGGPGPTGGTGGTGGTGMTAGTGGTGDSGGSGAAGGIGCLYGEHETGATISTMDMLITGLGYDTIRVEIRNQYNSIDVGPVTLNAGDDEEGIIYSIDKKTIYFREGFFYPRVPKAAVLNLAYTNLEKNVQMTIDKNFYIQIFHPLDGSYREFTPFMGIGKSIMIQIFYITSHGTLVL